jgi:sterol desaturase/sphingolipid hydroxylase (fatty acid hydroxylase superfamily)
MLDLLPLLLIAIFVLFLIAERVFPGRHQPPVKRWLGKGIFFFLVSFAIGGVLPELWIPFFAAHRLFDLSILGTVGGTFVALIASELLSYVVHRTQHNVPFIWRWTHQMHHSAERVDAAGAFYFHPLDSLLYAVVSSGAGALLGVTPEAAAIAGALGFAMACFQHANLETPVWLGWLVQRPEGHAIHHQRGVHAFNYGNIAIFDQLFGTYRNPRAFGEDKAGFWDGASAEVIPMLVGRDVGEKRASAADALAIDSSEARA